MKHYYLLGLIIYLLFSCQLFKKEPEISSVQEKNTEVKKTDTADYTNVISEAYEADLKRKGYVKNFDSAFTTFTKVLLPEYISQKTIYPNEAKKNNITGCVPVIYTIDAKNGRIKYEKLYNKVIGGFGKAYVKLDHGCEEEAIRVFKLVEEWDEHEKLLKQVSQYTGFINVCFPPKKVE